MKWPQLFFISLSLCSLLSACNSKETQIPDGIMDTSTFADFLTEAHLIESYHYVVVLREHDSLNNDMPIAYSTLYRKYNITPADYDSSLAWYAAHPDLLQETYERVAKRLKHLSEEENKLPSDPVDTNSEETPEATQHMPKSKGVFRNAWIEH